MSAWTALKDTYKLWKEHWKILVGIQVLWGAAVLALFILGGLVVGIGFGLFAATTGDINSGASSWPALVAAMKAHVEVTVLGVLVLLLIAAAMVMVSAWVSLATVKAWQWVRREEHDQMSVRNAYAATWPMLPRFIWAGIIAGALTALGFVGFVIPGIMLALAFSFLSAVVVVEGRGGWAAVTRTTRLARPYLFVIFWRSVVTGFVIYLPGEIGAGVLNMVANGLGDALNQIYGLVVSPIMTGVLYLTYLEASREEKRQRHDSWISLEKLALVAGAAVIAFFLILVVSGRV